MQSREPIVHCSEAAVLSRKKEEGGDAKVRSSRQRKWDV